MAAQPNHSLRGAVPVMGLATPDRRYAGYHDNHAAMPPSERYMSAGWWLVPSAAIGFILWVLIIRALFGWLA